MRKFISYCCPDMAATLTFRVSAAVTAASVPRRFFIHDTKMRRGGSNDNGTSSGNSHSQIPGVGSPAPAPPPNPNATTTQSGSSGMAAFPALPMNELAAAAAAAQAAAAAAQQDPDLLNQPVSWFHFGISMKDPSKPIKFRGKEYSQRDCFIKAVEQTPRRAEAWCCLGTLLSPGESVRVLLDPNNTNGGDHGSGVSDGAAEAHHNGKAAFTAQDCFLKALQCDPEMAFAWNNLGAVLGDETVAVGGVSLDATGCFTRALESANKGIRCPLAWANLAQRLSQSESATVGGKEFTRRECLIKAVEGNAGDTGSWARLAASLNATGGSVKVAGQEMTVSACLGKIVEATPHDAPAWFDAGAALGGPGETMTIGGKPYSQADCFGRSLELDPSQAHVWYCAAETNGDSEVAVVVKGAGVSPVDCLVKALELDPALERAWGELAARMPTAESVQINGKAYSRADIVTSVVAKDLFNGKKWFALSMAISEGQTVEVSGIRYSARACLHRALVLSPTLASAWYAAANDIIAHGSESEVINGQTLSALECFRKAAEADPCSAMSCYYWNSIGVLMVEKGIPKVAVTASGHHEYTACECFCRAVEADPTDSMSWLRAGMHIGSAAGATACIDKNEFTQQECILKAIAADPKNKMAWHTLGLTMEENDKVLIGGREFSRDECLNKMGSCDDGKDGEADNTPAHQVSGGGTNDPMNRETKKEKSTNVQKKQKSASVQKKQKQNKIKKSPKNKKNLK